MPNWDDIRREFETSKITLAALAEKHGIKIGTLKSRKSREGWSRDPTEKDATKQPKIDASAKKVATPKKKVATKSRKQVEPIVESDELTDKQRLFCIYYTKYFNATKAYQKAYECTYESAMRSGHRLLRNVEIVYEIERLKKELAEGIMLGASAVLQKYIDIAFADITDFVEFGQEVRPELDHNLKPMIDENGDEITYAFSYVNLKGHDEVDGTLITEVKKGKDGVSVKLADKMKALEFLAKYTDLLSENDKKRLQAEKLKAETEKVRAEANRISKENSDDELEEIIIVDEWSNGNE